MHITHSLLTVLMVVPWISNFAAAQTGNQIYTYDPEIGEVVLHDLENVGGIHFEGPNLNTNAVNAQGGFTSANGTNALDWLFFNSLSGDTISLGNIFPENLSTAELERDYRGGLVFSGSGVSDWRANPLSLGFDAGEATAEAGGPYKINIGDDLILDPRGTLHTASFFLTVEVILRWDLDLDGEFDDAFDSYNNIDNPPGSSIPRGISPELIQTLTVENSQLPTRFRTPGTYEIALHLTSNVSTEDFDTAIVIVVPEPPTCGLLGLAVFAVTCYSSRISKQSSDHASS